METDDSVNEKCIYINKNSFILWAVSIYTFLSFIYIFFYGQINVPVIILSKMNKDISSTVKM